MFPQNMSKSFGEMIEEGLIGFIILLAAMSLAGLIGLLLMIRSEKARAQQTETRGSIVLKVLIYYFLSVLFMGAVFVLMSSSLSNYNDLFPIDKNHFKALMTAASIVGYIFLLLGSIKTFRASGRGEKAPLKAKVFLIVGGLLFAVSAAFTVILFLR